MTRLPPVVETESPSQCNCDNLTPVEAACDDRVRLTRLCLAGLWVLGFSFVRMSKALFGRD